MTTRNQTYAVNESKAISETLEGETIIINIENGNYYSINVTGSVLWDLIKARQGFDQILGYFVGRYEGEPQVIEQGLRELITVLKTDNLIIETVETGEMMPAWTLVKEPFIVPAVERYEDMQEMLLADPIHDVDDAGWPILKQQPKQ